jgi:NAD(P)-dependent dehydrogenase (short-subunit alcohol dehydrogenase family)
MTTKYIEELFSLENKTALVIGGKGKIGSEISSSLAQSKCKVYVGSRSSKVEAQKKEFYDSLEIEILKMDASKEDEVIEITERIEKETDGIDILVNCSAWRPLTKFLDDSVENWEESIKTNSSAIFVPSRYIGRKMCERKKGSIINISSIYGLVAPTMSIYEGSDFETEPDYPFLKSGTIGLTKYFSSYFAKSNVRVNAVAPGGVENNQPEGFIKKYNYHVPMNRMANSQDIVGAVIYYASDASAYVTGTVLPIDGGWTAI